MIKVVFMECAEAGGIGGQPKAIQIDVDLNDPLTLDQCRAIMSVLRKNGPLDPECIGIDLKDGRFATYSPPRNCLRIWKDELPVFEDNDGVICKDGMTILEYMMR